MSLPPGFLDELRTRLSLVDVVGRKVMWDSRKSNQGKGDMWAPCPFHQEKTASFHVDDRKGYYYCFGCHAKGDAISFVRETENVDFMEAVRILAQDAGLPMPERDPHAQAKAEKRTELADVMDMAVRHFRLSLRTGAATGAREYLARRGLDEAALERFDIGFAPDAWQDMWDHLKGKGISDELVFGCGLAKPSQRGGKPYDTFRNRIIFPIRDPRGRCIAFGGRAMDPNDNAKYLNSPETELFDKSRTLYNHGPAREAAGKGKPLIVAEGYMDVIALSCAGFEAAVAPLGTAVTEHQLAHLWRIADEPVIALDGDTAGLRAAHRVIDIALPLLEAGKSLRFALMPDGQDPDDLLRAEGAGAVQALLDQAMPMVRLLWQRETEGRDFDSPERQAALERICIEKASLIRDVSVRKYYEKALRDLRWQLFNPRNTAPATRQPGTGRWQKPIPVRASTKASHLVLSGDPTQIELREAVILATICRNPEIVEDCEHCLESLDCRAPRHAELRDALLRCLARPDPAAAIRGEIDGSLVENLLSLPHVALVPAVRRPGEGDLALMTVTETLAKLEADKGLAAEISEAVEDMAGFGDESVTWRLSEAAKARNRAWQSQQEDKTEYQRGPNGASISRAEKERFDALLDQIGFKSPPDR